MESEPGSVRVCHPNRGKPRVLSGGCSCPHGMWLLPWDVAAPVGRGCSRGPWLSPQYMPAPPRMWLPPKDTAAPIGCDCLHRTWLPLWDPWLCLCQHCPLLSPALCPSGSPRDRRACRTSFQRAEGAVGIRLPGPGQGAQCAPEVVMDVPCSVGVCPGHAHGGFVHGV